MTKLSSYISSLHSPVPLRPELSTREIENKLPPAPSSSPAVIPRARWCGTEACSLRASPVLQSVERVGQWWMSVRWRLGVQRERERRNTSAVRECFGDRAPLCSHSVPVTFCSGFPTLTVRSALPLTSHLKGEGLISRWWRWGLRERERNVSVTGSLSC